jgi:3'-phosphoadenosine 5'-phosphosulfate sulfotransferase (PAPS reductase)/FAD synthetase
LLAQLPKQVVNAFSRDNLRILNRFNRIYVLVSGGKDSTYTVIKLLKNSFLIKSPIILLHNNTTLQKNSAKTILRIFQGQIEDQYSIFYEEILVTDYIDKDTTKIVSESAINEMPKAIKLLEAGKYRKNVFSCCYWLKEKPFEKWLQLEDHSKDLFVLSIKPGDSSQRGLFLARIRKQKTFFWFNRRRRVMYWYPLRDTKQKTVDQVLLQDKLFWQTRKSGCIGGCPVIKLFNKKK